jgi:hypothetical protein
MDTPQNLGAQDGGDLIVARESSIHSKTAQPRYGARDRLALFLGRGTFNRVSHPADIIIILMA